MRGDSTRYSTVTLCGCGARFAGATRANAWAQLREHKRWSGCR